MLTDRMMRAARLDPSLYNEVERDLNATGQAATVVVIVALAQGIGTLLAMVFNGNVGAALVALVSGTVLAIVGWILWSFVTYFIGTSIFGGTATPGEMLRCIGFAQTPAILGFFIFVPCLGGLVAMIGGIWALVAGIIAVREALDFDTGKAIVTALLGWLALLLLYAILGAFGLGLGGMRLGL